MTIYADTLVFLNTFVNYFLLMSTQLLCRRSIRRLRLLIASLVGGLYALTLLLDPMPPLLSYALKLVLCITLRLISDGISTLRVFIKGVVVFLMVSSLFAGMMLLCRMFIPQILFSGGIVYLDVNIPFLLTATVLIYLCIRLCVYLFAAAPSGTHVGSISICVDNRSVDGKAVFDTGNHLTDGFTGKPVLIVRLPFVLPILPMGVAEYLSGKQLAECDIPDSWRSRLRLFPYSTVGSDGLLPAFRCDSAMIRHLKKTCVKEKVYVAVSPRQLYQGDADALIPVALYDEIMEGEENYDIQNTRLARFLSSAAAPIRVFGALHKRSANTPAPIEKTGGRSGVSSSCRRRRSGTRDADRP